MTLESERIAKIIKSIPEIAVDSPNELVTKITTLLPFIQDFLEKKHSIPFYRTESLESIERVFNRKIPSTGSTWDVILKFFSSEVIPRFNTIASNKFLAYIPGDPTPASMLGAMMVPFFNQFVGNVMATPGGVAIEGLSLQWIKELMGFDPSAGACFTSGGSMANLTCLYSALNTKVPWLKEQGLGQKKPIIYCSDQTHNSVFKALIMFGLGLNAIHIIPTEEDFTINVSYLRKQIIADSEKDNFLPVIVIANAGTTNTGAIDSIDDLLSLTKEYNLWLHVDGAYGALSRVTDLKASRLLEKLSEVDSIALDAHKWMFVPYEAGISLVKDRKALKNAFSVTAEYLSESHATQETTLMVNYWEYSPQLSREFRGLKIWFFFMTYGLEGLKSFITKNIQLTKYLTARIREDPNFELMATSELSIVCFRWKGSDEVNNNIITQIQQNQNYYISRTTLKGRSTIRVCIINLSANISLIDGLLHEIRTIATNLTN